VEISATGTQYGSRQVDGKIRHKRKEEAMVGRRIDFDLDDRYAELLEQLIVVKNRLAEHDRGESDEEDYALTEAVAQALIAEETMRQFIDDLLDEALDKGQRLRQIASTVGAWGGVEEEGQRRGPHHSTLAHRVQRGRTRRTENNRALRMTARPEEMQPGDWIPQESYPGAVVEEIVPPSEGDEQVIVRVRGGGELILPRWKRQRILRVDQADHQGTDADAD
jgi:hypothetical protein